MNAPDIENNQVRPRKRMNPIAANLLIFLGYFVIAIVAARFAPRNTFSILVGVYGYMLHAMILIIVSILKGVQGIARGMKTHAAEYFLVAILLLFIGFGSCTFTESTGITTFFKGI